MTRPSVRRLGFAAILSLAVFAAVGTAFATVTEPAAPTATPSQITIPEPRLGDRAAYDLTLRGEWESHSQKVDVPFRVLDFRWEASGPILGGDGRMHAVDKVVATGLDDEDREIYRDGEYVMTDWLPENVTTYFQSGKREVVAQDSSQRWTEAWQDGLEVNDVPLVPVSNAEDGFAGFRDFTHSDEDHCLFTSALQGNNLSVGDLVHWPDDTCQIRSSLWLGPHIQFEATSLQSWDGIRTVHLVGDVMNMTDDDGRPMTGLDSLELWLADGIAYPWRITWMQSSQGGTFQLAGVDVGAQRRTILPDPPGEVSPLQMAPRQPWGMDDAGVDHEAPLSDVYQLARTTPTSGLPQFLLENPQAYVSSVHSISANDGGGWMVFVTGEEDTLMFTGYRTVYPWLQNTPMQARSGPTFVFNSYGVEPRTDDVPPASAAPATAPTVAAAYARWQAYNHQPVTEGSMFWDFRYDCANPQCTEARLRYEVGHSLREGDMIQTEAPQAPSRYAYSLLGGAEDGSVSTVGSYDSTRTESPLGPPASDPPADVQTAALDGHETSRGASFVPDAAQATGAGLVAILAGVLYWLWPTIKGSIAGGLFSRVKDSEVLDQPQRNRIQQLVAGNPGIHFKGLLRKVAIGSGALKHHLDLLVRAGTLTSVRSGGYLCYYPRDAGKDLRRTTPVLKAEGARKVIEAIRSSPGTTNLQVAKATGLDPGTVHYHVQKLAAAGMVRADRTGRTVGLRAL